MTGTLLASGHSVYGDTDDGETVDIVCNAGDVLVVMGGTEGASAIEIRDAALSLTWAKLTDSSGNHCWAEVATTTVPDNRTVTVKLYHERGTSSTVVQGFVWWRFSPGTTFGTPTITLLDTADSPKVTELVTTEDHSMILVSLWDYWAESLVGTTYELSDAGAATELGKQQDCVWDNSNAGTGARFSSWHWSHQDTGLIGSKTVGLVQTDNSQATTLCLIEVHATSTSVNYVYARPSADTVITGWTDQAGGSTNLYQKIDEDVLDTADYIKAVSS